MEIIKRKILLEDIRSRKSDGTYGAITGDSIFFKIMLTQNGDDMGVFNSFEYKRNALYQEQNPNGPQVDVAFPPEFVFPTPDPNNYSIRYMSDNLNRFTTDAMKISGTTQERLDEVRNYDENDIYTEGFDIRREDYLNYTGATVNGRDRVTVDANPIEYVLDANDDANIGTLNQNDGFYLKTFSGANITEIYYNGQGWNETNVGHSGLTKEEYLFGITSEPQVFSDVFIDRGITSPKETHLKFSEIRTINELISYGNGFFNIKRG